MSIFINGFELNTNFFLAPINTGLAKKGNPTLELINFHRLRSNIFTGISYVGNVAIDKENATNENTLYIGADMSEFTKLASVIEKGGSIPGVQIACANSKYNTIRNWKNSFSEEYIEYVRNEINNLSFTQIDSIIKSFQESIKKLYSSGFRAIQIHGAHGYLLNNFLSKTFNKRTDEFGKDRTLIVKEILDGLDSITSNAIIDLRISLFENKFEDSLNENNINFLDEVSEISGINIVSISNGIYNIDKSLIYPEKKMENAFMLDILRPYIDKNLNKFWNISGNVRDISRLRGEAENVSFSIGRPLIADSDFIMKHFNGRHSEIVSCEFCNNCHYFSHKKTFIECAVNNKVY